MPDVHGRPTISRQLSTRAATSTAPAPPADKPARPATTAARTLVQLQRETRRRRPTAPRPAARPSRNTARRPAAAGRHQAHRHQHQGRDHGLRAGARPLGSTTGSICKPAAAYSLAIDPGDGHEVRKLPEEHDQEQRRRPAGPSGAPTAAQPISTGSAPATAPTAVFARRARFERRVNPDIQQPRSASPKRGGQPVDRQQPDNRTPATIVTRAERRALRRRQAAGRQRPIGGPRHAGVAVALQPLVQRAGAGGHQRGANERVDQQPDDWADPNRRRSAATATVTSTSAAIRGLVSST